MTSSRRTLPLPWLEWLLTTAVISALAAMLPWHAGFLGWSWDALNHHVYLGLTADSPRWHLDVIPASVQTYQYPYLYWPVYQLSQWQGSAVGAAAVWSAFQAAMLALPVWLISFRLLPLQPTAAENTAWRAAACASAFMSMVVLAGLQTTANDLLVAVPLLWALALSLHPNFNNGRATAAAALVGAAIAFKLSSGLFLPWLLLWCWGPQAPRGLLTRGVLIGSGAALGFLLAYVPWGLQLWRLTGNPMHPLFGPWLGGLFGGP